MARTIIFHKNHFIEFYQVQNEKVKLKIQYVLELIKQVDRVPEKFLKHVSGTEGLYEIRIEVKSDIYRIFCCFDQGKLVILFNGFQKKSQKTPKEELHRAKELMTDYFQQK
ncbi:type II toxin-antitoxin system RelE/ParE family toxin [Flavobacterium foetidum]|uniref:type II toxin-antitoxin system RelE/ParE family toxin n=1 Tax=Flavobacterium foetidum TaxID=2026681 RepID=UPI001075265D|nr:type II toxin-antitoxin system RelE/ParE family toxin [Flavobacterium foetidum]KAF2512607.1 type II toxin-antitoxin system RelE/ParE family toxin [Flavobacterium foetidum]